jgi:predicted enzyme related to lactoylglutathione lyase
VRVGIDAQIRLTTDDAEALHKSLVSTGVDVDQEIRGTRSRMFTLYDPDGNRVVVVEQSKGR